jgi:hypothetical protein
LKEHADEVMEKSPMLAHLDLNNERDAERAIELLQEERTSTEWWAFVTGTFAARLLDEVNAGASPDLVRFSVWMQAARSALIFKRDLENYVWTGYRHTKAVYDVAAAAARAPEDVEKIQALRPLFSRLDEDVLHTWVQSGVEIGPKIGVTGLEEALLHGLADYHLSLYERKREEARLEREYRSKIWQNRIAAAAAAATVASVLTLVLTTIF